MTQYEKENACHLIEGYVRSVNSVTEEEFVQAKNELICNLRLVIVCAQQTSFQDFLYHFKTHSATIKPMTEEELHEQCLNEAGGVCGQDFYTPP